MNALIVVLAAATDSMVGLKELPKQLPLDVTVNKVSPVVAESPEGTDRIELQLPKRALVVYAQRAKDSAQNCPVKAGQHARIIAADTDLPDTATRIELRIVESGRLCKGRVMLTLSVTGANPVEHTIAGVTAEPGSPAKEKPIGMQRIAVAIGTDERPLTVTPFRFDTSDKFYVAANFSDCAFKPGDLLDVPPVQWSMCASGSRCSAIDAKTGTPCSLWTEGVQTADTLSSDRAMTTVR